MDKQQATKHLVVTEVRERWSTIVVCMENGCHWYTNKYTNDFRAKAENSAAAAYRKHLSSVHSDLKP